MHWKRAAEDGGVGKHDAEHKMHETKPNRPKEGECSSAAGRSVHVQYSTALTQSADCASNPACKRLILAAFPPKASAGCFRGRQSHSRRLLQGHGRPCSAKQALNARHTYNCCTTAVIRRVRLHLGQVVGILDYDAIMPTTEISRATPSPLSGPQHAPPLPASAPPPPPLPRCCHLPQ